MAQYRDIYMRDYVGDTGQVPSDTRQGVSCSPDIIPFGAAPDPNYKANLAENFNGPFNNYQNINSVGYNYIYVRGMNAFPNNQSGTINLFWSKASLLLWPHIWSQNRISNTNGTNAAVLAATAPGAVCVGGGAFYWYPPSIPQYDHFCLIAQVVTQQDPNVFPTTIADFAAWVANNANIAWRNVALVKVPAPNFSTFVSFINPESVVNQFTLTVTCVNVPDGAVVTLIGSEPTPFINYSGTVGPSNQTGASPKTNQMGWAVFNVPANFEEAVQLSTSSAANFPKGALVTYSLFWLINKDHPSAASGISPSEFNVDTTRPGQSEQGVMVRLGDFTFQF